ncbi:MAG: AmmeMemoRadiSam system radical SAM enzyme [Thermoplasmata archaeon]|uniref:AmmeMemoRadiSam system radical SAM enzyme n=1 Tax=Candidatus Sysuiplasma superficiale TaxID=2823368 RepID=A0A8J7YU86_9ARCH|nr:AmmeMemoRadiSam system radical SAM enzyme [Candidatus Sysuiplasma superficiale]MBX8644124.1 AmmeMemoRadiSam system radical SAM enzyme [Candidatus Sysuiplasma superficiale]
MKEAVLYSGYGSGRVVCTACARYCKLGDGQTGLCGIRQNVGGKLFLLAYGKVITGHIDPIEKKPLVHFRPGTRIFSIATTGCNWLCHYCQNYDISQRRKIEGNDLDPRQVVDLALRNGCEGIAYTYNEPSIYIEFAEDIGRIARSEGLFNLFVSNGFGTVEAVPHLSNFLDAITVDFKGNAEKNFVRRYIGIPDPSPIFTYLKEIRDRTKVHVEFTDLIVPEVGDSIDEARHLCRWILDNFGPDAPIHFLRFHPDYRMMEFPNTPVRTLERHCEVAKQEGLRYVYIGNVPGHPLENTYCPECGNVAIGRYGFNIVSWNLDGNNRCRNCSYQLPIIGGRGARYAEDRFEPVDGLSVR